MKKFAIAIMCALALCMVGCTNIDRNLLGDVKPALSAKDPYTLGKWAGQGGYIAYGICKGSGKNAEAVAMCEEIWSKVQADDEITVADINNLALQMGGAALNDKYGYVYSYAILLAVQAAGSVADQAADDKLDTEAMNEFLRGVKDGVKLGQTVMPPEAFKPVEKPKTKAFDCPDGNCKVVVGSRDIKHQTNVAKQLIEEGYVSKEDKRVNDYTPTAYENLTELIERCKILKKFKVGETLCYIKTFECEGGKLKSIEFRMIQDDGTEIVVDCVGCCTMPELDELGDDIEF